MKLQNKSTKRILRKAMAFLMAAALVLSPLASSVNTDAASKKVPKLSVKKKTLYYNNSKKKSFTLKVKKAKKVKKIKKTTWKLTKKAKKIVKLSKKKKTSVKITAKKKGSAKIKAVVKYIPKGSNKVKTKKLTCKITSKMYKNPATPTPTPTPTGGNGVTPTPTDGSGVTPTPTDTATPTPTSAGDDNTPTPTPTNTATPTPEGPQEAKTVVLSVDKAFISTAEGKNTVTLTATVKDANGKEIASPKITWASDNTDAASVDDKGVVTGVKDGVANITAKVDSVTSDPCAVTVDGTAPKIDKAEVTGSQEITVFFSEAVKGEPVVTVSNASATKLEATAKLAEDGKSLVLTCAKALEDGTYSVVINGLTDLAGNELAKDATVSAAKEKSRIKEFICETVYAPDITSISKSAEGIEIFYTVVDQYGQAHDYLPADGSNETLTVTASIPETAYPLEVDIVNKADKDLKGKVVIKKRQEQCPDRRQSDRDQDQPQKAGIGRQDSRI